MRKIIVTGGRDYADNCMFDEVMNFIQPELIVHGGCRTGADRMADEYLTPNKAKVPTFVYEADWSQGRKAGPLRNEQMLEQNPDAVVVAFPGGKGTEDCVKRAVSKNMIVLRVER